MTLYAKLALAATVLAMVYGLYHFIDKGGYDRRVAEENAEIIKATAENDALKKQLKEKQNEADAVIDDLLGRKPSIVRLPNLCPGSQHTAVGGLPNIEADRILLGETERILSAGRQRVQGIVGEAERELIDCRVVKNWAKAQGE